MARNKNKQPKKAASRRNRRRRRNKMTKQSTSSQVGVKLGELICSNTDPWCTLAINAKIYDSNSAPSLTYSNRQIFPISTLASGEFALAISTKDNAVFSSASTITSGAVVAWAAATQSTFSSQLGSSYVSGYRVVSYGVKFVTTQAWTSAVGLLIVNETTGSQSGISGQSVSSPMMGSRSIITPIRDAKVTYTGRALGDTSNEYISPTATPAYTTLLITMTGGAASVNVIGYLELVINYEWVPIAGTAYVGMATQAAPNIPEVLSGRAHVASNTNNLQLTDDTSKIGDSVMATAMDYVKTATDVISTIGGAYDTLTKNQQMLKVAGRVGMAMLA